MPNPFGLVAQPYDTRDSRPDTTRHNTTQKLHYAEYSLCDLAQGLFRAPASLCLLHRECITTNAKSQVERDASAWTFSRPSGFWKTLKVFLQKNRLYGLSGNPRRAAAKPPTSARFLLYLGKRSAPLPTRSASFSVVFQSSDRDFREDRIDVRSVNSSS